MHGYWYSLCGMWMLKALFGCSRIRITPHVLVWIGVELELNSTPIHSKVKLILPLRAYALTLPPIGFALRNVQTHISMRNCFEMCVCTLLNANPMGGRVRAYAQKTPSTPTHVDWGEFDNIQTRPKWGRSSSFFFKCKTIERVWNIFGMEAERLLLAEKETQPKMW